MNDWLGDTASLVFVLMAANKAVAAVVKIGVDFTGAAIVFHVYRLPFRYSVIIVSGAVAALLSAALGVLAWAAADQAPAMWAEARRHVGMFLVLIWAPTALFAVLARLQGPPGEPGAAGAAGGTPDDVRRARRELGYDD